MPSIASSAPEVLIGHVAGITKRIRVGAGGIMLPNHAPLRVLEIFRTLEALYPGRIDLGIGRAPGTDPITSSALRRTSARSGDVNEQLSELIAFATKSFPPSHPYAGVDAMPTDVSLPPIWMLGSTSAGAAIAASLGVGFAFAGHFSMSEAKGAIEVYRSSFEPTEEVPSPRLIMAVAVVCGENDADAEELALPLRVAVARISTGVRAPFPTLAEAHAHSFSRAELAGVERFSLGTIVGGPDRVGEALEKLAKETGADELMISTMVPIPEERVRSYERVAKLGGLSG
jgi:luciferase family oxidoreductase group 1